MMTLYYSPTSPYVRKVSATAIECGIALERERIDPHAPVSDYGKINPVHRIPALRLEDGTVLFDSPVICEYLNWHAKANLLPSEGPARWKVLRLQAMGDGILDAAVPRREMSLRPKEQQSPDALAAYERSIRQTLDALENGVDQLDGVNIGTIAVGCALGYLDFRFPGDAWQKTRPNLARWYSEFAKRPSMVQTMPKA